MLEIRRVVLYKHGVGYFERQGKVDGNATIELHFKASEMNDVLKSLTVLDLGGGLISSISYEGTKPISKQLEEISIRLPERDVLSGLMGELKGALVSVKVAGKKHSGKVVGIETIQRRSYEVIITDHRLILMVEGKELQSFDLLEIQDLTFEEEKIRKEVSHLLETLISSKKKDVKKLSVFAKGKDKREIQLSYILETPVWKTSYRLLMPSTEKEKPLIQGWALVDNTQDEDWENVKLSLIAGLPISFVHDLYHARYRQRPVIHIEDEPAYGPPLLESAVPASMAECDESLCDDVYSQNEAVYGGGGQGVGMSRSMGALNRAVQKKAALEQSVEVQKHVLSSGDFYVYEIKNPVTVKRDQSALVPILSEKFDGKKIAIYNPEVREKNPMSAILFKNALGMTLEGGPVTVLEGEDYVGEAMLDTTRPEDEKIIPYSVELGCNISRDHKSKEQEVYRSIIQDGVLYLHYYRLSHAIYNIQNRSDKKINLYLEHRFHKGWDLIETPKPVETTENFYRFSMEVPSKSKQTFTVVEKGSESRSYYITNLTNKDLKAFLKEGYLDKKTEEGIRKILEVKEKIASLDREIQQKKKSLENIFNNQDRVRKNLQVLGSRQEEQELRQRYIKQLSQEEDSVQALTSATEKLQKEKEELDATVSEKLNLLRFENFMK